MALILGAASFAQANPYTPPDPYASLKKAAGRKLCLSTEEYVKTLKFLRETKDFGFREEASRKIADQVSKGCTGAAERFAKILLLLKTVGMSEKKSLEMALEFAAVEPDVQKNFLEIFSKSFLAEFFDYEFPKAMALAIELSRDYKGDPAQARGDFIELVRFCKDSKSLDLSMKFCSDYAVQMAKLSQFFDKGVAKPFFSLFNDLRNKREFSLDVKTALEVAYGILKNGPMAQRNFIEGFEFASKDLELDKRKAIEFALSLSDRSFVGEKPPIMQFTPDSLQ